LLQEELLNKSDQVFSMVLLFRETELESMVLYIGYISLNVEDNVLKHSELLYELTYLL